MALIDARALAVVRDHVTTAAAYRETLLAVSLIESSVLVEIPEQVDRYGLANVIIQEPLHREVFVDLDSTIEVLSGASRVNGEVTISVYGPYRPSHPSGASSVEALASVNER